MSEENVAIFRRGGVPIVIHDFQVWTIREGKTRKFEFSAIEPTPSKPPGCRSRRCRRKTWRSRSGFSRNSSGIGAWRSGRLV